MVLDHARVLTAEEVLQRRLRRLDRCPLIPLPLSPLSPCSLLRHCVPVPPAAGPLLDAPAAPSSEVHGSEPCGGAPAAPSEGDLCKTLACRVVRVLVGAQASESVPRALLGASGGAALRIPHLLHFPRAQRLEARSRGCCSCVSVCLCLFRACEAAASQAAAPAATSPKGPSPSSTSKAGATGREWQGRGGGRRGREQEQREEGEEVEQGHGKQEAPGLGPPPPCRVGAPSTRARSSSRRSRRAPQAPGPGPGPGERSLAVPGAGPGHDAVEGPLGPLGGEAQVAAAGRERGYRHGLRPGTGCALGAPCPGQTSQCNLALRSAARAVPGQALAPLRLLPGAHPHGPQAAAVQGVPERTPAHAQVRAMPPITAPSFVGLAVAHALNAVGHHDWAPHKGLSQRRERERQAFAGLTGLCFVVLRPDMACAWPCLALKPAPAPALIPGVPCRLQGRPLPGRPAPARGRGGRPRRPRALRPPSPGLPCPPFCDFHAHEHRRLQQEHAAPQGGSRTRTRRFPRCRPPSLPRSRVGCEAAAHPWPSLCPGRTSATRMSHAASLGVRPRAPSATPMSHAASLGGHPKAPCCGPGRGRGGLAGPLGSPLWVWAPLCGRWVPGEQEGRRWELWTSRGCRGPFRGRPRGDFPFPDGWQEGGRYGAARSPAGVGGAGSLPQGAMRAPQGSPSQLLPEGLGSAESSRESAWAGQSRTAGRGSGVGGTDEAMGASRAGPLARAEAPQLAPADKPISGLQESLLSALGGQGRLEVASAVDASVLHRAPPGASYPGVAAFSEDLPRATSTSGARCLSLGISGSAGPVVGKCRRPICLFLSAIDSKEGTSASWPQWWPHLS